MDWLVTEKYCVFGKDFEITFKNSFSEYANIENEIKKELGDSKPLVAREVAKELCNEKYNKDDRGWGKLKELADKIKNL